MRCIDPVLLTRLGVRDGPEGPAFVACGRCSNCRLHRRAQSTAQAAMEGLWTRERLGAGHIWMVTPTYDEGSVRWKDPEPHNLQEWIPGLKPKATAKAARLEGPERAKYQGAILARRYGWTPAEVAAFRHGDYPRVMTLDRRDTWLWKKRIRKAGIKFRCFEAGEYGKQGDRPHPHLLFFGPSEEEMRHALTLWEHGFTDPNPHTWQGDREFKRQHELNARPGAAAKYAAKYLAKEDYGRYTPAEFAREHPYVASAARPALGLPWAERYVSPALAALYGKGLRRYRHLEAAGPMLAAYSAHTASAAVQLDGWHYPLSRRFRRAVLTAAGIPETDLDAAGAFAVEVLQERTRLLLQGGELADRAKAELEVLAAKAEAREARYAAAQARREALWAKEAA